MPTDVEWLALAAAAAMHFTTAPSRVEAIGTGLINRTFRVVAPQGAQSILQCVNPIHAPEVNFDIAAVTGHLSRRGVMTPMLIETTAGTAWLELGGRIWRMLSYIEGDTRTALRRPEEAAGAGRMLGQFHQALLDYAEPLHNTRPGVHDFDRHLSHLRRTLLLRRTHPRFETVARIAERILDYSRELPALPILPGRLVHGDPKISNFIFRHGTDEAICLVDLDTLAHLPLAYELGDALRSWCNPNGEDDPAGTFSLELLRAAVDGYAAVARSWVSAAEWRALVAGTLRIQIELAARFCADALNESYFGWDPVRYASRSEHNEVRATSQLRAALALMAERGAAEAIVAAAFA
ncbi:MAG: phosphotransferase [Gammaproteobacteria bacterium]|nr:phosphotransferase [Gammaproteobacteria bacterium]